jgi:nitrogen-specific signal transduction histidine kinase/CheY-like chemotaxis protein
MFRVACKDGGERIVETSMSMAGSLCLFAYNDVTEQHRTEELLRQSQKMEALGTMAGGVAHDFNNILTVILSCATLLKMHIAKDAKSDSLVNEIMASVDRATDLTRSLLAFSRKQATKLEPGDLGKVVSTLEKSLRRLIREDIEFRIPRQDGPVPVLMDRGQIEQVIVNLAVNARDAMPSGGVLSISTSSIDVTGEEPGLPDGMGPGRYAMLTVADTGVGMDAETRRRIFEPFFTTKEVGKGTGLGLSIVYGIVAGHGGFLRVASRKGHGTTFEVFLPMVRCGGEALAEPQEPEAKRGSGTILLVEDEEAVRSIITKVLEENGYRVLSAPNGASGVAVFAEHADEILAVVSDLVMPQMNGRTMADGIRRIRRDVPFVFMSGYPDDIVLDAGDEAVPTVCMQKPVKPSELLDAVNGIIARRASTLR